MLFGGSLLSSLIFLSSEQGIGLRGLTARVLFFSLLTVLRPSRSWGEILTALDAVVKHKVTFFALCFPPPPSSFTNPLSRGFSASTVLRIYSGTVLETTLQTSSHCSKEFRFGRDLGASRTLCVIRGQSAICTLIPRGPWKLTKDPKIVCYNNIFKKW